MNEAIIDNGWRVGHHVEAQYKRILTEILNDLDRWKSFKRDSILMSIWGQPTISQHRGMYNELRNDKEVFNALPRMVRMDMIGGAWGYPLDGVFMSRGLMRYADSLRLIHKHIGSLDGLRVLEFGAGFGGLCFCAHQVWTPSIWSTIDLSEAQDVQVRHCAELDVKLVKANPETNVKDFDLFIAEYSLTELVGQALWEATAKYIMKASQVFIRSNIVDPLVRNHWIEHLKTQFNVTVLRETPDAVPINSIVIGQ